MTNPRIQTNFLTRLRAAVIMLMMLVLFGLGVFFSRLVDDRLAQLVKQGETHLRRKYGISLSVGSTEAGFGSLTLSEVSVGDTSWFVIDKVKVSVSLNPFSDFLRPTVVSLGRAVVKLPWQRDRWPKEIEILLSGLKDRRSEFNEVKNLGTSAIVWIMPRYLNLKAARLEFADGINTKIFGDNVNLQVRFSDRKVWASADRVQILDRFDERFIEASIKNFDESIPQISVSGRLNKREETVWHADCGVNHIDMDLNCRIDAKRLPHSLVRYFQPRFGSDFAPLYAGNLSVSKVLGAGTSKIFKLGIDGVFGNIFVEHPSLALTSVGPAYIKTHFSASIDFDRSNIKIMKSSFGLFGVDPLTSQAGLEPLSIDVQGDISVGRKFNEKVNLSGFLNLDVPVVSCQIGLNAIPKSFVPELEGIKLRGTAELHLKANFAEGGSQFSINDSRFDCVPENIPEIFSAAYLNAPFNIERSLPEGKVYIPVDPARPYFTGYREVPKLVRDAFISSEDSGFFAHKGVEISAIIGAAERNTEEGRAAVGGSTITMQTVKNLFLARDKTISRKVQEVFLAWHLERTISKERILEIYLNMVEFGPGLYGIGLASQRFFGKHPRELSLKQAIYLASLLPAPVPRYRYFCKGEITANYDRIIRQLLDRMLGLGRISAEQHAEAIAEKLSFSPLERDNACGRNKTAETDQLEPDEPN